MVRSFRRKRTWIRKRAWPIRSLPFDRLWGFCWTASDGGLFPWTNNYREAAQRNCAGEIFPAGLLVRHEGEKAMIRGLLLGLAVGPTCLASCVPAMVPVLIPAQTRGGVFPVSLTAKFLAGRLIGYLLFGLLAWGLGN